RDATTTRVPSKRHHPRPYRLDWCSRRHGVVDALVKLVLLGHRALPPAEARGHRCPPRRALQEAPLCRAAVFEEHARGTVGQLVADHLEATPTHLVVARRKHRAKAHWPAVA